MFEVNNILHPFKEPRVYLCQFKETLYGVALLQSLCDGEDTHIRRVCQFLVQVVELHVLIAHEAVHSLTYHAQTLLQHLFECAANRHNLAYGLHA